MHRLSVNISTIFTEVPFIERFEKAKEAGFAYVECQFPYSYSSEHIKDKLADLHLSMVLLNLYPGNWDKGDRGMAIYKERTEEFKESVYQGIEYARHLNVNKMHCMAGVCLEKQDSPAYRETYIENLRFAAQKALEYNITILIEPINHFDMPGYFLNNLEEARKMIKETRMPNLQLQYDFYHIQRLYGESTKSFLQYKDVIGHVQIADTPGRHQPGTGDVDFLEIFQTLSFADYQGFVGLEYNPLGRSEDSFEWLEPFKGGLLR